MKICHSSMDDFAEFKILLECMLKRYEYTMNDVSYINLDKLHYIEPQKFISFECLPLPIAIKYKKINWCNKWNIPPDFKVVMNDGSMLIYNNVWDEYYNDWIYISPPNKAPIQL